MAKHKHQHGDHDARLVGRDSDDHTWNYVEVDNDGFLSSVSHSMIWNSSTLAWEAATGSLSAGGNVSVNNFPATQTITDPYGLPTNPYRISDYAASADPSYYGHIDASGNWYILQLNKGNGTVRYAKGTSGYAAAWANRAGQSYNYFDTTF